MRVSHPLICSHAIHEMTMSTARRNSLLAALPDASFHRLERHLHPVLMNSGAIVNEPGDRMRDAIFPESGIISVINIMQEGQSIEVGTIGREGMCGVPALLGEDLVPFRYVVQVPGSAVRMKSAELNAIAKPGSPTAQLLLRYYVAFTSQIMQSVACAGLHSIEQRCCRWLLTTHDRVQSDRFSLTHEFLAAMLGTRRTSVSQVLKKVRDRGLIEYRRGAITILDRRGLEAHACECYRTVADIFRRVKNPPHRG